MMHTITFQPIPAIDIIEGKCVRLTKGDYSQKKVYNEHPLEVALQFEAAGLQRLHLVDLDGAKLGKVTNWKVLEMIATKTKLIVDFGGGVQSASDVETILNCGAKLVTIGSLSVKNPSRFAELLEQFGASTFFLGADVKNNKIAISGWLEQTDIDIIAFLRQNLSIGVQQFFCTDIALDGMMLGPSLELYKSILAALPSISLVASGGVSQLQDVVALQQIGMQGAIIGKAIYEGSIQLNDLQALIK